MPVTTPVEPTVATEGLDEDHVPPEIALESVMVLPTATDDAPAMVPAVGAGTTVTVAVAMPLPVVYVMIEVPDVIPYTTPELVTTATLVSDADQEPPVGLPVSVTEVPVQIPEGPLMPAE